MPSALTEVGEFFRLGEFSDKRGGGLPPATSHVYIARLCCVLLDPLRREFGPTTVHSGYRTDASNATVGGASESLHMYHRYPTTPAADVSCAKGTPAEWFAFLDSLRPKTNGLGRYRGHVHADRRAKRTRWTG